MLNITIENLTASELGDSLFPLHNHHKEIQNSENALYVSIQELLYYMQGIWLFA